MFSVGISLPLNGKMMKYYIECFYSDGGQILGNLDGQAVLNCKKYKCTKAYKRIKSIVGNPKHMNGMVASARVVTEYGHVMETIR